MTRLERLAAQAAHAKLERHGLRYFLGCTSVAADAALVALVAAPLLPLAVSTSDKRVYVTQMGQIIQAKR